MSEVICSEGDASGSWEVGFDAPAVVGAVEADLLIRDAFPCDLMDRYLVQGDLKAAVAPVNIQLQVGDVVERERRRSDPELRAAVDATDPFDDVVDVEDEIGIPVPNGEVEPVDVVIVPGQVREVVVGLLRGHDRTRA